MDKIRILVADDHLVVRRGLVLVLRQEPDFEIVGEAKDGEEAVNMIFDRVPHVVVLDWKMPRKDGLQAAKEIKHYMASVKTLILSGAPIEARALDALDEGVDGFAHKDISPQGLIQAIRTVASGKNYLGTEITQALIARSRQKPEPTSRIIPLSPRELQVLTLMATSATYKEIARQLGIGEPTVRTYVGRILTKLNQPDRTQAIITAIQLKLVSFD